MSTCNWICSKGLYCTCKNRFRIVFKFQLYSGILHDWPWQVPPHHLFQDSVFRFFLQISVSFPRLNEVWNVTRQVLQKNPDSRTHMSNYAFANSAHMTLNEEKTFSCRWDALWLLSNLETKMGNKTKHRMMSCNKPACAFSF